MSLDFTFPKGNQCSLNLPAEDEKDLVDLLVTFARSGFPLSRNKLCSLAWEYAYFNQLLGLSPLKRKAGNKWLKSFLCRNPLLKPKKAKNISVNCTMCANPVVMKCKSTGSSVATFLGTDNLRHPYNSIVYCGRSFPYSIQTVNDISTRSCISIYTSGYPRIKAMQYERQV